MISGVITGLLIVIFCAIVGWAYSNRRRGEFDAMARVPLADDSGEKQP
jgi:cbb3-type cytochrome oxidase subunit 3